jgi:glycosyltransferase involved in cell wall biosynthesis
MICPLRDGGGTRIKILDGLALGIPIISTSVGTEGIAVTPERDVLIADSRDEFVRQITRVFTDAALRARLAAHGRALAESRYSWDSLADSLGRLYGELVGRCTSPTPSHEGTTSAATRTSVLPCSTNRWINQFHDTT